MASKFETKNMKQKQNAPKLTALCIGCKFATIQSGTEFICNRPGMSATEVAAAVIDTFFGERCKEYEPTKNK